MRRVERDEVKATTSDRSGVVSEIEKNILVKQAGTEVHRLPC